MVGTKEARLGEEVAAGAEEPDGEEPEGENKSVKIQQHKARAKSKTKEPAERTDDPVRIYLRQMGSVELLSHEGEIAIAKRLEAGREAMIAGLCESPLTFQAIVVWRDELNGGKISLREVIDLEALYTGPDGKAVPTPGISLDGEMIASNAIAGQPGPPPQLPAADTSPVPFKPAGESTDGNRAAAHGMISELGDDEDDEESWLSTAALEAELKPKLLESFDAIAGTYKRLRRLQDQDIQFQIRKLSLSPSQERKYKKLKNEIIGEVKSLRLNRARIAALIEQLYDINKRLAGYEGRLMRLAESHGIVREDFLTNYLGSELDPLWLNRVSKLGAIGWKFRRSRQGQHQGTAHADPGAGQRNRSWDR
jgi:RNA polymerase primary sigma factor